MARLKSFRLNQSKKGEKVDICYYESNNRQGEG